MISSREHATVLAALRHWQQQLRQRGNGLTSGYPQFAEERPLSENQIDQLCERLNQPAESSPATGTVMDVPDTKPCNSSRGSRVCCCRSNVPSQGKSLCPHSC